MAFADRIVLNKCDLVDEAQLLEVERRIRMINESVAWRLRGFKEVSKWWLEVKIQRATQSKAIKIFMKVWLWCRWRWTSSWASGPSIWIRS